jgi:hypothetical protein
VQTRQVLVTLSTQRIRSTQASNALNVRVFHNGASLEPGPTFVSPNRERGMSMPAYALLTLPAGTHTFDVRWSHTNQSSVAVAASVPKPGNLLSVLILE